MADGVDLSPVRYAALVAPAIDRIFPDLMLASRAMGGIQLSQRYGGPPATGCLIDLRTRLGAPGGTVSAAQYAAVTRYRDPLEIRAGLLTQAGHGMITLDGTGTITATDRGREFVAAIYALHARVTETVWEAHPDRVAELAELAGRALAAAMAPAVQAATTDGHALSALAPPHEPVGTPTGVLLLNRLSTLRYHRADAHAAAWQSAGLTAPEIMALGPGPVRDAVEAATNTAAAAPWRALNAEERLTLLAGLAALPAKPR